jgi:hypothetical protein
MVPRSTRCEHRTISELPENRDTHYFDFLGLLRELRDKIYEQPVLFKYEHIPAINDKAWITKAKKLRTSLLSVSHQFRNEYTERCAGQQVLCMRDHCSVWDSYAVLQSPNRARFWIIEFFVRSENIRDDLEMLMRFLNRWAIPDLALRTINIRLLFVDTSGEYLQSSGMRRTLSGIQAIGRLASLEIYLADKLWDFRRSGTPKIMIAR